MQYYPLLRPTAPSARSKLALRNLAQGQEDVRGGHPRRRTIFRKYTPNTTDKILVFQALLEVHRVAQQSEAAHQAERRPMGIDHPDNEPSTASCTDQCNALLLAEIDQEFFRDSTPYRVRQDPGSSESMLAIMSLRADHITGSREDDDEYNKIQLRDYLLYTFHIYS
ncbi:hypothetical protein B0H17DRAFT_1147192 [Mycena rosella]|uniref:Uncharacterized protein n=1 Tax=Mycena rosella TaxID=1033263 RepID=A0AAD7CPM2_MYCRO|nr:hypothetical protein B0H17DRAFT_1147192 [Mycena rosella]